MAVSKRDLKRSLKEVVVFSSIVVQRLLPFGDRDQHALSQVTPEWILTEGERTGAVIFLIGTITPCQLVAPQVEIVLYD